MKAITKSFKIIAFLLQGYFWLVKVQWGYIGSSLGLYLWFIGLYWWFIGVIFSVPLGYIAVHWGYIFGVNFKGFLSHHGGFSWGCGSPTEYFTQNQVFILPLLLFFLELMWASKEFSWSLFEGIPLLFRVF